MSVDDAKGEELARALRTNTVLKKLWLVFVCLVPCVGAVLLTVWPSMAVGEEIHRGC